MIKDIVSTNQGTNTRWAQTYQTWDRGVEKWASATTRELKTIKAEQAVVKQTVTVSQSTLGGL